MAAGAVLAAGAALAEPLPKDACDTLKSEQDTLAAAGIADDLSKGPQWAKANLPRERLAQIGRYISLEEQLLFRCGLAKLKSQLPQDPEESAAQAAANAPPVNPAPPVVTPKAKPKPKAVEATEPAAPSAVATPEEKPKIRRPRTTEAPPPPTQPTENAAPKPKIVKPKVDDAYRPPAANPAADPFAKQLAPAR